MWQARPITVWSAQSFSGALSSKEMAATRTDFLRWWIAIDIGAFTQVNVSLYITGPDATAYQQYDAFQVNARQVFSANFTGTLHWSANSGAGTSRGSCLPICSATWQARIAVSGSVGASSPSITLLATPFMQRGIAAK